MCRTDDFPPYEDPLVQAIEVIDTVMEAVKARATCHAVVRRTASPYGEIAVRCGRWVGTTTWTDEVGLSHSACSEHIRAWQSLWPVAS